MTATAPATISSPQMVFRSEHHQPVFIEIKVADRHRSKSQLLTWLQKFGNALSADAGSVFQFRRDPCQQFLWNTNACAPAWPLMTANPAQLTVILAAAKRAKCRLEGRPAKFLAHLFAFLRHPNFSHSILPRAPIIHAPGSGTIEIASICVRPLNTSIRRKLALCKSTELPSPSRAQDKSKPAPPADPP